MTSTDLTTTPAKGTKHAHGLTATDKAIAALTARVASLENRVTALEAPVVVPPIAGAFVNSIPELLTALADDTLDDITVKNGTYAIRGAGFQSANSLWIGARYAARTRPITIRAESTGGVVFDGQGGALGGISFEEGAHDQTWDGFTFVNGVVTETGLITAGGYAGKAAAHHITMRNITIPASIRGSGSTAQGYARDHAIYGAMAVGGPHDFLFEDIAIDCSGGLASGLHFDHGSFDFPGNDSSHDWTLRRARIVNAQQALLLWHGMRNVLCEDVTIAGSSQTAVTYQYPSSGNVLRRVVSTGSRQSGLYAPNGQAGLTLDSCSLA